MRQAVVRGMVLLLLVGSLSGAAALAAGCAGKSLPSGFFIGTAVSEVVYQGHTYRPTDALVGLERMLPDGLAYAGTGLAPGEQPSAAAGSVGDTGYEVYTITGVDPNQAIAVKFAAADRSGKGRAPYWVWMRYEREQ